jgi:peptide/nickel transport system permease protein
MFAYIVRRLLLVLPVTLSVSAFCFLLVHIAPGDPLISVLPADSSAELAEQMRKTYGFDRPLPVQFGLWLWRALRGDLGMSIATGRPVLKEVSSAAGNTIMLALAAGTLGFSVGIVFGFLSGYFHGRWLGRAFTIAAIASVSMPHYWLGMVLVVIFSVWLGWLPAVGAGSGPSSVQYLILPAITMSVIPIGIVTLTVRAIVVDILSQEFVTALRAKGLPESRVFTHVAKNAAPATIAIIGLQFGYLLGGSILIETVFSWPGTGLLLNSAIFERDLPLLQGIILVLALFFVFLNLLVDILQALIDPRIKRGQS